MRGPVLVVGPVEPPIGGVSRYCRSLVDLLRADGLDAVPLDPDRPASGSPVSFGRALDRPLGRLLGGGTLALSRAVRGHGARLVVDNRQALWREPASARGARLLLHVPHVLAIHDGAFPQFVAGLGESARRRLARDLGRLSGVLCMSDAIVEAIARIVPAARAFRLEPLLRPPDRASSLPAEIEAFFAEPGPVLCASGALHPQYGLEDLLSAVAALRRSGRPARLVLLLGTFVDDPSTAEAVRRTRARLGAGAILPLSDFADGASIIARSQLYVRPSRVDSYGMALHEAMLLGVPVVASAHPTRPEGIFTYRAGDIDGLAKAIESGLAPEARSEAVASVPRHRATVEANARRTLEILAGFYAEAAA